MTERPNTSKRARRSSLSHAVAVFTSALASFLVVLALLTARVVNGQDPVLASMRPGSALVSHGGHTVIRTTASGRVLATPAAGSAGSEHGASSTKIVTHTSGSSAAGGEHDA